MPHIRKATFSNFYGSWQPSRPRAAFRHGHRGHAQNIAADIDNFSTTF
jgi:hypothetical protein